MSYLCSVKMMKENMNANLRRAKSSKYDKFYTRLEDIESELGNYEDFFNGKVVYCNCDRFLNGNKSNFFVYFSMNYERLGLRGLICTTRNPNGKGKKYETGLLSYGRIIHEGYFKDDKFIG